MRERRIDFLYVEGEKNSNPFSCRDKIVSAGRGRKVLVRGEKHVKHEACFFQAGEVTYLNFFVK